MVPIVIRKEDIPEHLSQYCETTDECLLCLDLDKDIWVRLGVPVENKKEDPTKIRVPNQPYVFMAHELYATDKNHSNAKIENVPVIFAHGYRDNNTWRFADGQGVVDTVTAFDGYIARNNLELPGIEFVIACNMTMGLSSQFKIKDFYATRPIVQVVGEPIAMHIGYGNGSHMKDGKVVLKMEVAGEFWGLDDLLVSRQVRIIPPPEVKVL